MKIISIDPGFERVGIAILEKIPKNKEVLLYSECFKTSTQIAHHERLFLIGQKIEEVIKKYKPESLVIEELFFNTNQKTIIGVAEARGVIMYEASKTGINVFEYSPLEVKVAVTGYGRSEKRQVTEMVTRLIDIKKDIKSDDEFDAIAIGLTHFAIHKHYPHK